MLLPALSVTVPRFSPLQQYLESYGAQNERNSVVLSGVSGVYDAMAHVCDQHSSNEGALPAERLYRLSRTRALAYLGAKAQRLAAVLRQQAEESRARARAQFVSFTARSDALSTTANATVASAPAVDAATLSMAVGILGEYLTDDWVSALASELGCVSSAVLKLGTRAPHASV